ncbi:MAG: class I SAM-dependent methyltransferase [Gammaproteobacteria bacterium]
MTNQNTPNNQKVIALFDLVSDIYENPSTRFFSFCGDQVAQHLKAGPGQKVLDIAAGTGCSSIALAQTIQANNGRVTCVDLSEGMLKKAQQNIDRAGLSNVDYHIMDGQKLDFKSKYFDYVNCSYGIFFMPDMDAALQSWYRVLKPGGTILFTTFTEKAFEPLSNLFFKLLSEFGVSLPETKWQLLKKTEDCKAVLEKNNFVSIEIVDKQLGYHLTNFNDWWEVLWSTGYRGLLEQLSDEDLAKFRIQHSKQVTELKTEDGIWMDVETHFSMAKRPQE